MSGPQVRIENRQRAVAVDVESLRDFARRMVEAYPPPRGGGLTVRLVGDRTMARYNQRFRGRGGVTDVLAFPAHSEDDPEPPEDAYYLGDVVICAPQAARQARRLRRSLTREFQTLMLHGYLHLLGYDHETDDGSMMRLQRRLERQLAPPRRR